MEQVRLNHFILWCKGWYEPKDKHENVFETLKKVLALDGYECVRSKDSIFNIVLIFIDDLIEKGVVNKNNGPLRFYNIYHSIKQNKNLLYMDDDEALIYAIKNFFAFDLSKEDIKLNPPTYSRRLYKMGLKSPIHFGNTYKSQNTYVNNFFKY